MWSIIQDMALVFLANSSTTILHLSSDWTLLSSRKSIFSSDESQNSGMNNLCSFSSEHKRRSSPLVRVNTHHFLLAASSEVSCDRLLTA